MMFTRPLLALALAFHTLATAAPLSREAVLAETLRPYTGPSQRGVNTDLRLTGSGAKMLRGEIPLTDMPPAK